MSALLRFQATELGSTRVPGSSQMPRLSPGTARFVIHATGAHSCLVRFEGAFKLGWAGNLTSGLAALGVSVRRARAMKGLKAWTGELEIDAPGGAPSITEADLAGLVERDRRVALELPLALTAADTLLVSDHGGSLLVRIQGRDRVGFLASILDRFSFLSLFPVELQVGTTSDGAIDDRFHLQGPGGRSPDADAAQALARQLGKLVEG